LVSSNPLEAKKKGIKLWIWDLIFYGTFGIVITSSVQLGGILLVFSILIVPALLSRLIVSSWKMRLIWGWIIGSFLSIFGLFISLKLDTPTGSTLVALFGISLFVCILMRQIMKVKI